MKNARRYQQALLQKRAGGQVKRATCALASILMGVSVVEAAPTVNGTTISWPSDGWYQVLDATTYDHICEGGTSCEVPVGKYIVINHTTGERFTRVLVDGSTTDPAEPTAAVTVEGQVISWPDDGWYQVQDAVTYESVCQGGLSCEVPAGKYTVINHTTGERFNNILVQEQEIVDPGTEPESEITVDGLVISWPDDGDWYQVQDVATGASICQGGLSCEVEPGTYRVINLSTGERHGNFVVTSESDGDGSGIDYSEIYPGDFPGPVIPTLAAPYALPIPAQDPDDWFGTRLEVDDEEAVAGGPPTQPKNLRADLISNNWAEISWAPSNDDEEVVQYTIRRSDGVEYIIRNDQIGADTLVQRELDKYWQTTSFIDCNDTRFDQLIHRCGSNTPIPGETYTYTVTATDDEGQESIESEPLTFTYFLNSNAPVPYYNDVWKSDSDRFVQEHDLSGVPYWLDEFELVFSDEFEGDEIDATKWNTSLVWGDNRIVNREQQYFVNILDDPDFGYNPFEFTGESVIINANPVPDELRAKLPPICDEDEDTNPNSCDYLSGALASHDRYQFLYGYAESRMKVSDKQGALSSFYLYHRYAGNGLRYHAPEIDILEYLGVNPYGDADAFQTYHFADTVTGVTRSAPTMSYAKPDGGNYSDNNEWHTFGVLWEPQLVIWYIDGREVKRMFGPQVSHQPMNIVSYLASGTGWAGSPDLEDPSTFPIQMEIDYFRVFQRGPYIPD